MRSFYFIIFLFVFPVTMFGQIKIKGNVMDESTNEAIIGANIKVKGTNRGTITDLDGNYKMNMLKKGQILVFSFIGYDSKEIKVTDQKIIDVKLSESSTTLDEVVAIGYGNKKKSDLTGSVASVKSKEIMQSQSSDILQALQGRLSGVQIDNLSGDPASGYNINIRGVNSINAGTSPLYVIDGVQYDINDDESLVGLNSRTGSNPLSMINPNNIKSIEVLKDASATSIFGARGANGVIIITTNNADEGTSSMNFNYSLGITLVPDSPLDILDAQGYIDYRYNTLKDSNYGNDGGNSTEPGNIDNPKFQTYNYPKQVLRNGLNSNYNFSYLVNKNGTSISTNLGYSTSDLIFNGNTFNKFNGTLKVSHKYSKNITIGSNISYNESKRDGIASDNDYSGNWGVTQKIYLYRPVFLSNPEEGDVNDEENVNFLKGLLNDKKESKESRLVGKIFTDISLLKKFTFHLEGNINRSNASLFDYRSKDGSGYKDNGYGIASEANSQRYSLRTTIEYKDKFKENSFGGILGYELSKYNYYSSLLKAKNFPIEANESYGLGMGLYQSKPLQKINNSSLLSYFTRIDYNYKSKYYATVSTRIDGSSKFGKNNRYGVFPSIALSWRINEEHFLKEIEAISNAKLRLSYGITGNDRIPDYQTLNNMESIAYASPTGDYNNGIIQTVKGNENLKWESTKQTNIGFDLSFLNNRISITTDIFRKDTKDMLFQKRMPSQTGVITQWQNIGSIRNDGIEFQLSTINIQSRKLKWASDFNINIYKSKVMNIGGQEYFTALNNLAGFSDISRLYTGEALNQAWGYKMKRILQVSDFTWQNNSDPSIAHSDRIYCLKDNIPTQLSGKTQPGDFYFEDISGPDGKPDGVISAEYDKTFIGNANPEFFGGLNNTITYKNFDVSFLLKFSYGRKLFYLLESNLQNDRNSNKLTDYVNNQWTYENPSTQYCRTNAYNWDILSSYYMHDASFLKMQNINFGYTLPVSITKKAKIKQMRFNVSANNVFCLTNYPGVDPDCSSKGLYNGVDISSFPNMFSMTFGVNLIF